MAVSEERQRMTSVRQFLLLASASAFMLLLPSVASATLPPTISTQFVGPPGIPPRIPVNESFGIIFTLRNPNASSLTGVGFTETFPSGLVILNPNGVGGCGGGTITAVPGTSTIGLAGATLAGDSGCLFGVNVASTTGGTKTNTTGPVTSNEGGTGESASVSFVVDLPPTIAKAFGATQIAINTRTSLTFTIQNPNALPLTSIGFTDSLPSGLNVSPPDGLTGSCGAGRITIRSFDITLTSATLAGHGSCSFGVDVTGTATGTKDNMTGLITSSEGGHGSFASASLSVTGLAAPPPTIPTLQDWAIASLGLLLLIISGLALRRRK